MSTTAAMDWPLSREEKKRHLMHLYDRELHEREPNQREEIVTDSVIMSGQAASFAKLAKLQEELEAIKNESQAFISQKQGLSEDSQRLREAVEAATAVFRAVIPTALDEGCDDDDDDDDHKSPAGARRAKSAGSVTIIQQARSCLSRTPRGSLSGKGKGNRKKRVSFGEDKKGELAEPEPEEPLRNRLSYGNSAQQEAKEIPRPQAKQEEPSPAPAKQEIPIPQALLEPSPAPAKQEAKDRFKPGDRVKSLTSAAGWEPRCLKFGDAGTVVAPRDAKGLVKVEFDGDPKMVGPLYENQLERIEDKVEEEFKPGDRVKSLLPATSWTPRPLKIGDAGTVLAPKDKRGLVKVKFDGDPELVGRLRESQLEHIDEEHFKPGDRVKSLLPAPSWTPRPLKIGDKGTVLAQKDARGLVKVEFDGDPKIVGPLYENQLEKI